MILLSVQSYMSHQSELLVKMLLLSNLPVTNHSMAIYIYIYIYNIYIYIYIYIYYIYIYIYIYISLNSVTYIVNSLWYELSHEHIMEIYAVHSLWQQKLSVIYTVDLYVS